MTTKSSVGNAPFASLTEKNCVHWISNRCEPIILLASMFAPLSVAVRVFASMMIVSHAVAFIANLVYSPVEILVILSGQVMSLMTLISHLIGDA